MYTRHLLSLVDIHVISYKEINNLIYSSVQMGKSIIRYRVYSVFIILMHPYTIDD